MQAAKRANVSLRGNWLVYSVMSVIDSVTVVRLGGSVS